MIFSFFNEFPSRPVGCKTWIYLFHNMSSLTLLIGKIVRDIFKMHQVSFLLLWNNIQCVCYVNVEKLRDTSIVWKENISTFLLSIKCWLLQKNIRRCDSEYIFSHSYLQPRLENFKVKKGSSELQNAWSTIFQILPNLHQRKVVSSL